MDSVVYLHDLVVRDMHTEDIVSQTFSIMSFKYFCPWPADSIFSMKSKGLTISQNHLFSLEEINKINGLKILYV